MEAIKSMLYGMSNFAAVMGQNCYYVDKTMYLPMIEDFPHPWRHAHLSDICSTHESDPHPAMAKRRKILTCTCTGS